MIVIPEIKEYLLNTAEEILPELREYAGENYIPILQKESVRFIISLLLIKRPANILEIGTAIGYSSIIFSKTLPDSHITTIEVSEEMIGIAEENFKKYNANKIKLIEGDASEVLEDIQETYDFVFIDAQKSKYEDFLKKSKPLLKPGALIVTDNVLLKGMVADESLVPVKKRSMVRHIQNYNEMLKKDEDFYTSFVPIGDGIAISVYKKL